MEHFKTGLLCSFLQMLFSANQKSMTRFFRCRGTPSAQQDAWRCACLIPPLTLHPGQLPKLMRITNCFSPLMVSYSAYIRVRNHPLFHCTQHRTDLGGHHALFLQSSLIIRTRLHTHARSVCAISKDGRIAAVGGKDVELQLWSTETGELLSTLRGHEVAWTSSTDSTFFVTVQEDSKVWLNL